MKQVLQMGSQTVPEIDEALLRKLLPPYKVILHNDEHNSMDHVVKALLKSVPQLKKQAAIKIMMTAHEKGKAVVTACPREIAELYQARLLSFGLTCTIERDE
ncbi:ATP-dependent Clp protease adaptor ClpS [Candidatus Chlorohelix sp.]|uniref:ATP-dependent Clp protease adaptor ClpS n=1 Tax=Candidatus Chlorohelix sp. TaxID=3139201 RepID=UPI00305D5588